jgi:hypothetical protein
MTAASAAPPRVRRTDRLAPTLVLAAVVLAVALAVRHVAIEPAAIAHACDPAPWAGACAARTLVILGFVNQEVGWLAFAAGALATLLRAPRLASLALAAGCAGLVLYSYEPAAVGALLGLLVRARAAAQPASTSISAA